MPRCTPVRVVAVLILVGLLSKMEAFAATPRDTEVGSEEERLRRPKKIEAPPRVEAPIELPAEEPAPMPSLPAPRIQVRRIVVEGSSILPEEEVERLTEDLVGKTVTLEELRQAADSITRWYRQRGYVTSRAFIPAQTVEEGLVRIRVIEAKVGEIQVEGNRHFRSELLARQLKAQRGQILQLRQLEGSLRRLNAHPDRKVKLILAPGAKPETTDLILQVKDQRPIHGSYGIDTLGNKTTGEFRHSWILAHGNLTGQDDQVVVRGVLTEFGGLFGGAFSYLRPMSPSGMTATLDASGVKSSIGGDLKNLLARGNAVTVSPGLIAPLVQRANWELEAVSGFDWKRIRTQRDESVNSKDDLRIFHIGTNLLEQDSLGQGLFIQELRVGVGDFLGGSHPEDPSTSRAKTGGSFVRWIVSFARVQEGPFKLQLLARGSGAITTDRLVPAEQFRLGGFDTVRGYPEGEFLADSGYQTTLELRAPLERFLRTPALQKDASTTSKPPFLQRLGRSLLLVAFWDFAEGFLRDPASSEDADERLSGVGCGLRLRPTAQSILQLDFGWRIGDADREKDKPRLHLICRIGF